MGTRADCKMEERRCAAGKSGQGERGSEKRGCVPRGRTQSGIEANCKSPAEHESEKRGCAKGGVSSGEKGEPGYTMQGRLFAYGYIRALLQATEN